MIELKTGHTIVRRNGSKQVVMLDYLGQGQHRSIGTDGKFSRDINFDSPYGEDFDIMAVYEPKYYITALTPYDEDHKLVWER